MARVAVPALAYSGWRLNVPGGPAGGQTHGFLGRFGDPNPEVYRGPAEVPPRRNANGPVNTVSIHEQQRPYYLHGVGMLPVDGRSWHAPIIETFADGVQGSNLELGPVFGGSTASTEILPDSNLIIGWFQQYVGAVPSASQISYYQNLLNSGASESQVQQLIAQLGASMVTSSSPNTLATPVTSTAAVSSTVPNTTNAVSVGASFLTEDSLGLGLANWEYMAAGLALIFLLGRGRR